LKLTDWIPGDVKPVRDGVYQRMHDQDLAVFKEWSAFRRGVWHLGAGTPLWAEVYGIEGQVSINQRLHWRGLAEQPK